jgi:hydroxylaminobenzene mutase
VGLLTGLWVGATATGKVIVAIPHLALSAHLNALFGGLWLIAVAFSLEFSNYSESQVKRLYLLVTVACWSNWFITLIASFLGVRGLSFTGDRDNDTIAVLLQIFVVLPSLIGAVYWVRGFLFEKKFVK